MAKKAATKTKAPKSAKPKAPKAAKAKAPAAPKAAAKAKVASEPSSDSVVVSGGPGRPAGAANYTPSKELEVRDSGNYKGTFDGPTGPRWIRVYAGSQPASLQLKALADLIAADDPSLLRLLAKQVKASTAE